MLCLRSLFHAWSRHFTHRPDCATTHLPTINRGLQSLQPSSHSHATYILVTWLHFQCMPSWNTFMPHHSGMSSRHSSKCSEQFKIQKSPVRTESIPLTGSHGCHLFSDSRLLPIFLRYYPVLPPAQTSSRTKEQTKKNNHHLRG